MYVRLSEETMYHKLVAPPIQEGGWLRQLIQKVDLKSWFERLIQKSEGWFRILGS